MFSPFKPPSYTQTPNELIDDWLPHLSHVELKVLMVILRKTFGWHKIRDRISLSQLEKMTGSKRTNIISATKKLEKKGLIKKYKIGNPGEEESHYELVINDDSNNCYQSQQGTGGGPTRGPTKETSQKKEKEIYKEKDSPAAQTTSRSARRTTVSKISLEGRKFSGISEEDMIAWRTKFPSINVQKEIDRCVEWALINVRKNYRKSLFTWFSNCEKNHTTAYKQEDNPPEEVSQEDVEYNKKEAQRLEKLHKPHRSEHYAIDALQSKICFILPNNQGYDVEYHNTKQTFHKLCQKALDKMKRK